MSKLKFHDGVYFTNHSRFSIFFCWINIKLFHMLTLPFPCFVFHTNIFLIGAGATCKRKKKVFNLNNTLIWCFPFWCRLPCVFNKITKFILFVLSDHSIYMAWPILCISFYSKNKVSLNKMYTYEYFNYKFQGWIPS